MITWTIVPFLLDVGRTSIEKPDEISSGGVFLSVCVTADEEL